MVRIGTYRCLLLTFATFIKNNEHFVFLDDLIKRLKESAFKESVKNEKDVELALDKLYRHNVISDVVSEKGDLHINILKRESEKIRLRFEHETNEIAKKVFDNYRESLNV